MTEHLELHVILFPMSEKPNEPSGKEPNQSPPKADPLSGFRRREGDAAPSAPTPAPAPSSDHQAKSPSRDTSSDDKQENRRSSKKRPRRDRRGDNHSKDRPKDDKDGSNKGEKDKERSERRPPRNRNRRNRNRRNRGDRDRDGNDRERNFDRNSDRERPERKPRQPVDPGPPVVREGMVEISPKGFGFLRQRDRNFAQHPEDVFITPEIVRQQGLRDGVWVKCISHQGHRGPQLSEITEINGREPEEYKDLPFFEELTAINPNKRLTLETTPERYTTRVIDLMTPIGRGQRGLIVAPPRTGKTTLLQHMAEAIIENYEDPMHLMILLVDERPEEVTDFQRTIPQAEIMASSNDGNVKEHTRIAQLAIERAKRLVEAGEHVFLLMDSITRLARAFNNSTKGKGRTMSGGIDVKALEIPRKLFAAARNTREAGSLTIIATALIQTNSKMDELIYQEFKGTGNMELVLDRALAQNYVYPAVDIAASGTRREELILPEHMLNKIHIIRRGLSGHKPIEAMERLLSFLERFPNNAQMLMEIKAPTVT